MSRIIMSAFSDEYATPFEEQLAAMQRYGIEYIELRHANGTNVSALSDEEQNEIERLLAKYGIRVSSIGSPLGKIRLDEDHEAHLETAKRVFAFAKRLGAKYIRVFSYYAPEGEKITDHKEEVLTRLSAMLSLAREYGVTLCHENEANIYGDTPIRCRELLDYFGGELKCVFDMGNFVLEQVKPYPDGYELLREYIAYFHIKDALAEGAIVPPGCGDAKIKEILAAHKQYAKEDFFTVLEPHLQTFSGLNALVGRSFENPYKYEDAQVAFDDAVIKYRGLIV